MRAWQIRLSTRGRVTLFPSEELRRTAVCSLARVAGEHVLCFSAPDDHGHVIVMCKDESARRLARSIRLAWAPLAGAELDPPWVRPFLSRAHLQEAFEYQLKQNKHHGLGAHAATWSANCFVDLVGARHLPELDNRARLSEALPRYRMRNAFTALGLPPQPLVPADEELVRAVGVARLAKAAAAACCAPPDMEGRGERAFTARTCVGVLSHEAGFSTRDLIRTLDVSAPTARRLVRARVDERYLEAVRVRLALEQVVEVHG